MINQRQLSDLAKKHASARALVNKALLAWINSQDKTIQKMLKKAVFPGRRIRSSLVILLSSSNHYTKNCLRLALAIELAHRASIVADDIMDEDIKRRNTLTFHAEYGVRTALPITYFLVSESDKQIADVSNDLLPFAIKTQKNMSSGQLADIGAMQPTKSFWALYFKHVTQKTMPLFELAGIFASYVHTGKIKINSRLIKCMQKIGTLYQLENDFYDDLRSEPKERGDKIKFWGSVSMLSAIVLDQGTASDKNFVYRAIQRGITINLVDKYHKILQKSEYAFIAETKIKNMRKDAQMSAGKLETHNKEILKAFINWIQQPTYWNHFELKKAGYGG